MKRLTIPLILLSLQIFAFGKEKVPNKANLRAFPFELRDVQLLDSPFRRARDIDVDDQTRGGEEPYISINRGGRTIRYPRTAVPLTAPAHDRLLGRGAGGDKRSKIRVIIQKHE
jgi:hypothetical protein